MAAPRRRVSAPSPANSTSDQPSPSPSEQPAVAQQLDRRGVLGQAERVVQRRQDDPSAELDAGVA